jgi:hypothetical protein
MPGMFSLAKCIFLTIDSASTSGVVLSEPEGKNYAVVSCSEVTSQETRHQWVRDALELSRDTKLPLVIVGEEWTNPNMGRRVLTLLGESWGMWRAAIEYEGAHRQGHIVRVNPNTWRAAVFGKKRPQKRDELKKFAVEYVHRRFGEPLVLSDNIAEALCIRVWAERAEEVHALLAPRKKKAA